MQKIKIDETEQVPLTPEARLKELKSLSNKHKEAFLPPVGSQFRIGPYIFKVSIQNVGQLRFTANLVDVVIEGINDD